MILSHVIKALLFAVYTPLTLIALITWIVQTIFWREQWECIMCRLDDPPSIKQQFLYFTIWSMWFSITILTCWSLKSLFCKTPSSILLDKCLSRATEVGVPHILTVFISYIYYLLVTKCEDLVNSEDCYTL